MPRAPKTTAAAVRALKAQEMLWLREVRLARKVARTAAAELGEAFEQLGACRARLQALRSLRGRK